MWLISCQTLQLEYHVNPPIRYAILSHTWESDEVVFQDMADLDAASQKAGFIKIKKTCEIALEAGIPWSWVDTCCIDKRSSAELSEAINSMFAWYRDSTVCYVWLADLHSTVKWERGQFDLALNTGFYHAFAECRWFTRGWTLQELIAPDEVIFFNHRWENFGTRQELIKPLHNITGIDENILEGSGQLSSIPVARRMSWASHRETTRAEDVAYCLLGIFDINMPLLYGEGSKAFLRLQEEIARSTNDMSLFAWRADTAPGTQAYQNSTYIQSYRGLFADSPLEFVDCSNILSSSSGGNSTNLGLVYRNAEFAITNRGVRMEASLLAGSSLIRDISVLFLNCSRPTAGAHGTQEWLGIIIAELGDSGHFVRAQPHTLNITREVPQPSWIRERRTIYIRRVVSKEEAEQISEARTTAVSVSLSTSFNLLSRKHSWFKYENLQSGQSTMPPDSRDETTRPAASRELDQTECKSYRASELIGSVQVLLFAISVPDYNTVRFAVVYGFSDVRSKLDPAGSKLLPWVAIYSDDETEDLKNRQIVWRALELEGRGDHERSDARRLIYDILFSTALDGSDSLGRRPTEATITAGETGLVYRVGVKEVGRSMAFPFPQPLSYWVTCEMVSVPESLKRT